MAHLCQCWSLVSCSHTFEKNFLIPYLPLADEVVPTKKPVYVQDQIATDDQGRRRFHGAFTGGFSAGYWNTVGSKEGWTPQSFKSSRSEKASGHSQRPEDFMDDEDLGEFGIAPKGLQIQEDYTGPETSKEQRKRKFLQSDLKAIPGEPVLQQLLRPVKDKVSVRILKSWGWRPGQGLGPRQTRKEKKKARERNKKELYLLEKYGCELPTNKAGGLDSDDDDQEDDDDDGDSDENDITFAPEDFEPIPYGVKEDRYGLGYKPLSRHSVLGGSSQTSTTSTGPKEHFNLFKPLEMVGKNNQKISFAGQAFGVGALEEDDDEDVYATDDLARYDFSLEDKKKPKKSKKSLTPDELIFEDFHIDLNPERRLEYKIEVPFGWQPRNWYEKRSRFEPLDPRSQRQLDRKFAKPQEQSDETEMTREKRAELLGEEIKKKEQGNFVPPTVVKPTIEELQRQQKQRQQKTQDLLEKISAKSSSFQRGGIITLEGEEKPAPPLSAEEISSAFKPFANDEAKQKRYEKFLAANLQSDSEIDAFLNDIQPIELSLWDRQMERKEFVQAKKLYRPLKGIMSDRFVTESQVQAEQKVAEIEKDTSKPIVVERTKMMWKPHSLLCKRYNIAEPYGGLMEDEKKKSKSKNKMSVFDYLETSVNRKEDFQTPVIIPKNIEKPQELVKQQHNDTPKITEEKEETVNLEWENVLQGKATETTPTTTVEKSNFVFKPKTDLEKQVVESFDKPITEKKELFKSIFSDSESDQEEEEEKQEEKKDMSSQLTSDISHPLSKPLNAAAANLLRNNSPPRGIFKALFNVPTSNVKETVKPTEEEQEKREETITVVEKPKEKAIESKPENEPTKIRFQPKSSREPKVANANSTFSSSISSTTTNSTSELYGPALPSKPKTNEEKVSPPSSSSTSAASVDAKLLELFNKHKPSGYINEVWVEKSSRHDSSDSSDDSSTSSDSSSSDDNSVKHKKRSKKSKKKKSSSDHKHKKHKDHNRKSSKKSKKSDKKKKKKHKKK
ncbi:LOW QUALITY PROTEIN: G patch domain-containing protein 1 homolog [Musca vetustissima]|uniref:LOW QUALITY PROTEIN: G patch domain-containing protein 1 homolog n=1 Tax=Musca vetustissima TaxID=27455 RepID=UPI002AB7BD44|nr:LOW QUALITY PROTEIN: G patch domain-containing protein 1 homolog [Musca vetustissima]